MSKAMNPIFKVLLCVCALSVSGAGAAYAGPKEDARDLMSPRDFGTPNYAGAVKLVQPLAEGGDAEAREMLGDIYASSLDGHRPDYALSAKWYQKAAAQGLDLWTAIAELVK